MKLYINYFTPTTAFRDNDFCIELSKYLYFYVLQGYTEKGQNNLKLLNFSHRLNNSFIRQIINISNYIRVINGSI